MHSVISYRTIDTIFFIWYNREYYLMNEFYTIFFIWYNREYYLMNEIKCWHENSKKKLLVYNNFF